MYTFDAKCPLGLSLRSAKPDAAKLAKIVQSLPADELAAAVMDLANVYTKVSGSAVAMTKRLLYDIDADTYQTAIEKGVTVNPQSATYEIQDKVYAVKVVDGKAAVTELTDSRYNDGHSYLVKSGLVVGDTIVSEGTSMIQDGQEIKVTMQGKERQR